MDRIITEDGPIPEAGKWNTGNRVQLHSLVNHRFCCPGLDGSPPESQSAFCPRCSQLSLLKELGITLKEVLVELGYRITDKGTLVKEENGGEH